MDSITHHLLGQTFVDLKDPPLRVYVIHRLEGYFQSQNGTITMSSSRPTI